METRPRLLIVEDDAIVRRIYAQKFSVAGFDVITVPDGESALREIKTNPPEIVLLDLMLPGVNGVEVLKQLRALPATSQTPVVVFSNSFLSNVVEAAWKAGATKCISKI